MIEEEPSEFFKAVTELMEFHEATTSSSEVMTDLFSVTAMTIAEMLSQVPRQQRVLMRKNIMRGFSSVVDESIKLMLEARRLEKLET